jgi:5-methylcytosine-specific restriction endonuclease McrA
MDDGNPEILLNSIPGITSSCLEGPETGLCGAASRRRIVRGESKHSRLRLDADTYRQLYRQVLERDGWRCQNCGSMSNLEVHHQQFRSHSGSDSVENLITLCASCHAEAHVTKRDRQS